ncbi:MAG: ABC transporter ATP-binding protein [Thaumarchaeota archaeon]|nr:ABC transporter ATP-binding protein [Nitrososphaerota archaeon]
MSEVLFKTEKLSKSYVSGRRTVNALEEIDLVIRRGEFVAITGHSGSGKTTLLNILACLDRGSSGKVLFDGVDVQKLGASELNRVRRDKVGFVFQSFNLLPYLSAKENVELPMEVGRLRKEKRTERSTDLLASVGLEGRGDHRPNQLSAGEQQRVAIARALANGPSAVLADEPTGNLDPDNKAAVISILRRLNIEQGMTVIMVTHDGDVAERSERIVRLAKGKIRSEGRGKFLRTERKET